VAREDLGSRYEGNQTDFKDARLCLVYSGWESCEKSPDASNSSSTRQPDEDMSVLILIVVVILGLAIYGAFHLLKNARQAFARRRLMHQQEEHDEREFWEHDAKRRAIRAKYDPKNEWNEATSLPADFVRESTELNLQYRQMLQRRNGWTAKDFDDSEF
jgi:uncharacterized protein HemX